MRQLRILHLNRLVPNAKKLDSLLYQLTKKCPNVINFSIGSEDFSNDDVLRIVEGWPNLKYFEIVIAVDQLTTTGMKHIATHSRNLKQLSICVPQKKFPEHSLEWQFNLYHQIPKLEKIVVRNLIGIDWATSTREVYYDRQAHRTEAKEARRSAGSRSYGESSVTAHDDESVLSYLFDSSTNN